MIIGDVYRKDRSIKNAHIWPNHTKGSGLALLQLDSSDMSSPRNFLRLQSRIEYAFDRLDTCFVTDSIFVLEVKVFNPCLCKI